MSHLINIYKGLQYHRRNRQADKALIAFINKQSGVILKKDILHRVRKEYAEITPVLKLFKLLEKHGALNQKVVDQLSTSTKQYSFSTVSQSIFLLEKKASLIAHDKIGMEVIWFLTHVASLSTCCGNHFLELWLMLHDVATEDNDFSAMLCKLYTLTKKPENLYALLQLMESLHRRRITLIKQKIFYDWIDQPITILTALYNILDNLYKAEIFSNAPVKLAYLIKLIVCLPKTEVDECDMQCPSSHTFDYHFFDGNKLKDEQQLGYAAQIISHLQKQGELTQNNINTIFKDIPLQFCIRRGVRWDGECYMEVIYLDETKMNTIFKALNNYFADYPDILHQFTMASCIKRVHTQTNGFNNNA